MIRSIHLSMRTRTVPNGVNKTAKGQDVDVTRMISDLHSELKQINQEIQSLERSETGTDDAAGTLSWRDGMWSRPLLGM